MADLSDFGKKGSDTAVITRRDGSKEYYSTSGSKPKLVAERDSSGTSVARILIEPSRSGKGIRRSRPVSSQDDVRISKELSSIQQNINTVSKNLGVEPSRVIGRVDVNSGRLRDIRFLQNGNRLSVGQYNNYINDRVRTLNDREMVKAYLPSSRVVSDVLYKLEARAKSIDEQKKEVNKKIAELEEMVKGDKDGYYDGKKVNVTTLKSNLNLMKCILYVLDNKKGDGFFEAIEIDGTRCLTYLVRDGDLIPYWYKTPNHNGEPVILVPDIVQRKKFWREATDETIQDFNESQDHFWRGVLGFLTKVLIVIGFAGLLFWTFYLARWSGDLHDESLQPEIDRLKLQNEQIRQSCSDAVRNQIENNGVLIDYAKLLIGQSMNQTNNADSGGTPKDITI